jgi:hypothetical protein
VDERNQRRGSGSHPEPPQHWPDTQLDPGRTQARQTCWSDFLTNKIKLN